MGTHPIFESDFDCLTVMDKNEKFRKILDKFVYIDLDVESVYVEFCKKIDQEIEKQKQIFQQNLRGIPDIKERILSLQETIDDIRDDEDMDDEINETIDLELNQLNQEYGS